MASSASTLTFDQRVAVARLHALSRAPADRTGQGIRSRGHHVVRVHLLEALHEADGHRLRLSALASRTNATLARLSRVVTSLERKDLVLRAPCAEDGRATNAVLTEAGETVPRKHGAVCRRGAADGARRSGRCGCRPACEPVVHDPEQARSGPATHDHGRRRRRRGVRSRSGCTERCRSCLRRGSFCPSSSVRSGDLGGRRRRRRPARRRLEPSAGRSDQPSARSPSTSGVVGRPMRRDSVPSVSAEHAATDRVVDPRDEPGRPRVEPDATPARPRAPRSSATRTPPARPTPPRRPRRAPRSPTRRPRRTRRPGRCGRLRAARRRRRPRSRRGRRSPRGRRPRTPRWTPVAAARATSAA